MKNYIGVSATDHVVIDETGKDSQIMPKFLMQMVWDDFRNGIPLILEHDYNYLIGWDKNFGIHIEPGITRSLTISEIVETQKEQNKMVIRGNQSYNSRISSQKHKFDELKKLIRNNLDGTEIPFDQECVCYYRKNLAIEVFPKLFENVDRYGLISINDLEILDLGIYKVNDLSIFAHRFFKRSNSILNSMNIPFLYQLSLLDTNENEIKIRLDSDIVGLASTHKHSFERKYWWGPLFNDDLTSITPGETKYGVGERKFYNSLFRTDFRWKEKKDYYEFEAEELYNDPPAVYPSINNINYHGCRYVHSIIRSDSNEVHFDGAVRLYTIEELHQRILKNLSNSSRKNIYYKLWRVDGEIQVQTWKRLLSDYYRDNYLVGEYLGGREKKMISKKMQIKKLI